MKHVFSPEGDAALSAWMAHRPLLAFDFDGTLAPIVARPHEARIPTPVAMRLARLARLLPLAIITGRTVEDARARLSFEPRYVIGSHGAENPHAADGVPAQAVLQSARERLSSHAQELDAAGVQVEDKLHSIALHYRLSRDGESARQLISRLLHGLGPEIAATGGKRVVNVVAAQAPDKARALESLVAGCGGGRAVFVGDDVNDEPVFARREPAWLGIRVGRDHPESQACYFLDDTADVALMLDRMLVLLDAAGAGQGG